MRNFLNRYFPQFVEFIRKLKAKKWSENSIVFYVGSRKEPLVPDSLKTGASGSYTAVIKLSQEWAKLGYQVTVYSTCDGKAGSYDGVNYVDYCYFNPYDYFNILIIFQHPYLLPSNIKAKKVCLEWQDVLGNPTTFPSEKLAKFDVIFAKSQYQRGLMPFINDHKFVIVTNGVDANISELANQPKNPYKLIYASRYYRGLDSMLTYGWSIIKQAIPEAELHIYYGFVRAELSEDQRLWRENLLKLLQQPGIFEHGKVGQDELILAKSSASIHYYGCTYEEIDCVSVRESAMVGCVPVTTDYAVFKEKNYCLKVPGNPKSKETQVAVANSIVELLQNPTLLASLRQEFQNNVSQETWDHIAKVWVKNF